MRCASSAATTGTPLGYNPLGQVPQPLSAATPGDGDLTARQHERQHLCDVAIAMLANAARAAAHASKRADDGEGSRAVDFASEAIRTALRLTRLDLPALAQQAVR